MVPSLRLRLEALERHFREHAPEVAIFLVYDRPDRVDDRPGLARAYFAERCVSDAQLEQTLRALREVGAYVEMLAGEIELLTALADGRIHGVARARKLIYNGIEGGISTGGFRPGRKALIPAVADAYGIDCSNSNAYACALGRHKFHYLTLLRAAGLPIPRTWHFRLVDGWANDDAPPHGMRVIVKPTFESWSVGVTDESIFVVDSNVGKRVSKIAQRIGQAACVQEFVPGQEVCVPVICDGSPFATPPMLAVLAKAPGDPTAVMTIDDNLKAGGVTYAPFDSDPGVIQTMAEQAVAAFRALELTAFARIDFRVDENGAPWIFDVGVSPGLSRESSAFASFAQLGFSHAEFLRSVLAASLLASSAES